MYLPPNSRERYPILCWPKPIRDFCFCIHNATGAKIETIAPILLAAAAAAVQGLVDVKAPFGTRMPTSMFFGVVGLMGLSERAALRIATAAFAEFECGTIGSGPKCSLEPARSYSSHPFLIQDRSTQSMVDIFEKGALSLLQAHDEGAMLLEREDMEFFCNRFDGAPVRKKKRTGIPLLSGRRASLCMLVQPELFKRARRTKRLHRPQSELLSRMLLSFVDGSSETSSRRFVPQQDPFGQPIQYRLRSLLLDYTRLLASSSGRIELTLDREAGDCYIDMIRRPGGLFAVDPSLEGIEGFVARAGEHVVRLAAVLQWILNPQGHVQWWAVDAAVQIVQWHLAEALCKFGQLSPAQETERSATALYQVLLNKALGGQTSTVKGILAYELGVDPNHTGKFDRALQYLSQRGLLGVVRKRGGEKYVVLEANWPQNLAILSTPTSRPVFGFF